MDCLPHIHATAIHAEAGYRATTPGIGVICRDGNAMHGAGVYVNSVGKTSGYVATAWQPLQFGSAKLGVLAGVVNGYAYQNGAPFVFGAGIVSIPIRWGELHTTVVPPLQNISPATLGFSFAINFN